MSSRKKENERDTLEMLTGLLGWPSGRQYAQEIL